MIQVNSKVKLNAPYIRQLTRAQIMALEQTAEALHTEVVQAQVVPRMDGTLQNEAFFVDKTQSENGSVSLIHSTPYARRLYYHPEYNFHKEPWEETWTDKDGKLHKATHEGNPNARGKWFVDWMRGGKKANFAINVFKAFYRRLTGL